MIFQFALRHRLAATRSGARPPRPPLRVAAIRTRGCLNPILPRRSVRVTMRRSWIVCNRLGGAIAAFGGCRCSAVLSRGRCCWTNGRFCPAGIRCTCITATSARALREHGSLSCYDPSFHAGYPKTPVSPRSQTLFGNALGETPFRLPSRSVPSIRIRRLRVAIRRRNGVSQPAFPNRVWERE